MYLVVESLRCGSRYLYKVVDLFIDTKVIVVTSDPFSEEQREIFWSAFGVPESVLEDFVAMMPRRHGDGLSVVCQSHIMTSCEREKLRALLVWPWTWRKYNSARFLTIGTGALQLTLAKLVGLDGIMAIARAQQHTSEYWIHHFDKLNERKLVFIAVVGLGTCMANRLTSMLMKDGRVPMQAHALQAAMREEQAALGELGDWFWSTLGNSVVPHVSWVDIRTGAMSVASTTAGWFHTHVLTRALSPPWNLCQGKPLEQAKTLWRLPAGTTEPIVLQLQSLLRSGLATEFEVATCIFMLKQCSWMTLEVEQAHGSIAVMRRVHPDLAAEGLAIRSFLHMARSMFTISPLTTALQTLRSRLHRLGQRNPNMLRGQNIWWADTTAIVRTALPPGSVRGIGFWRERMRIAGGQWSALSAADRLGFVRAADDLRSQQWEALGEQQEHLAASISLLEQRSREEQRAAPRHLLGSNRFEATALHRLWEIFQTTPHSHQFVDNVVGVVARAPTAPDDLGLLAQIKIPAVLPSRPGEIPAYVKTICWNREVQFQKPQQIYDT